jgi:hypothetical protein
VTVATRPTPSTDQCSSTCSTLSVIGKVSALGAPIDDSAGDAAVTFGDDHWYVAWGGRPAIATQIQRFTADGEIDGTAKKIAGTTPSSLGWLASSHQLVLEGWVPPAYSRAGYMESFHRFDAALTPVGDPMLMRTPMDQRLLEAFDTSSGPMIITSVGDRIQPLVREIVIDPAAGVNQTPAQKQWFMSGSASEFLAVQRASDKRIAVMYDGTNLTASTLADDGSKSAPKTILNGPFEITNVGIQSLLIGNTLWIGAWANKSGGTTVHLVTIDPNTLAPASPAFALAWPSGTPNELVNGNGALVIRGTIEPDGKPSLPALVPIDTNRGAACRPIELALADQRTAYQDIRALHFEGAIAGAVFETWGGQTGSEKEYFARLSCSP